MFWSMHGFEINQIHLQYCIITPLRVIQSRHWLSLQLSHMCNIFAWWIFCWESSNHMGEMVYWIVLVGTAKRPAIRTGSQRNSSWRRWDSGGDWWKFEGGIHPNSPHIFGWSQYCMTKFWYLTMMTVAMIWQWWTWTCCLVENKKKREWWWRWWWERWELCFWMFSDSSRDEIHMMTEPFSIETYWDNIQHSSSRPVKKNLVSAGAYSNLSHKNLTTFKGFGFYDTRSRMTWRDRLRRPHLWMEFGEVVMTDT